MCKFYHFSKWPFEMVSSDPRSTNCKNLKCLRKVAKHEQVEWFSSWRVRELLPLKSVPGNEKLRLGLLTYPRKLRLNKYLEVQDSN